MANALLLVDESSATDLGRASKLALARQLIAEIAKRLQACGRK
jgi:phosphopantothenoylcysteine decarboxylase/phosphopantothenate--cysteine ligase